MTRHWRKLGLTFRPNAEFPWMLSHAAVPIAEHLDGNLFRVYFSARDSANRSVTGSLVMDLERPNQVLELTREPVIAPGKLGTFDDSGAMATWLTCHGNRRLLWYIGWNLGVTVPFRNSIGLAVSLNGGPFEKFAEGPILDRTPFEPHFCASCCVLREGDLWRNWYLSTVGWQGAGGGIEYRCHIKYAESVDGIAWRRAGAVAIDFQSAGENVISRPSVLRDAEGWHMWYSHRGNHYRIGYARSENGEDWTRYDNDVGIDVTPGDWDGEMIEYPFVFEHKERRYMLYNGNGFGLSGFGLAVWEN
ncbi:hypothetical protein [Mycobacterium paragordonae]|uniref:hypothetical protein n=1 Tax=Mycobacterium paragordonae TaxID=1389713 RepID=UPI0012E20DE8|nr:hypothetical protein [Mycobacterium paragordonae]